VIGQTVSHYRILEKLGEGGMGVVYKAHDTKLDRDVALKFLPSHLSTSEQDKARFVVEAKAASALNHPNILTIYDFHEEEGQSFIAMELVEGESLRAEVAEAKEKGTQLPIPQVLGYADQIAQGLSKAHEKGIVHRDIKSENIMVTNDGLIKIMDFGLAKLKGKVGVTKAGSTVGTAAYMSPEQVQGEEVDEQTDIWSFGVVIHELVTGKLPFRGEHESAMMYSIMNEEPKTLRALRPETPEALEQIVTHCLLKDRTLRTKTIHEISEELSKLRGTVPLTARWFEPRLLWKTIKRPAVYFPLALVLLVLAYGIYWQIDHNAKARWARENVLPEVERLIGESKWGAAYALALKADQSIPDDPVLLKLWPQFTIMTSVKTNPPGARVFTKDYFAGEDAWIYLGQTPIDSVRYPRGGLGVSRLRIEKDGYNSFNGAATSGTLRSTMIKLDAIGSIPADVVRIPGGKFGLNIPGLDHLDSVQVGEYLIDKYEVTNREFKEFVDQGGYQKKELWKEAFVNNGRKMSWEEALREFRDATGRPGPATWELGTYPEGKAEFPVGGISWYEAAAYAEFRGKSLPTVYHWNIAAETRMSSFIVPLSNFENKGPAPVGKYQGVSPLGAVDMAGNVREWCINESRSQRCILGGGWNDQPYSFNDIFAQPPFDRSVTNGARCIRIIESEKTVPAAYAAIELPHREFLKEQPVPDHVFRIYLSLYKYDRTPLNARIESSDTTKDWIKQKITLDAAYGGERLITYLFLPKGYHPPYEAIVYFPGSDAIYQRSSTALQIGSIDFFVKSGRAVVYPIYKGTYERGNGLNSDYPSQTSLYREHVIAWAKDIGRSIDYLETRNDINAKGIAYYGVSWGAAMGAIMPAVEQRFKTCVLYVAGLNFQRALPEVDAINFISRVKIPVIMLNGKYDNNFPVETSQKPMFSLFGTPTAQKKHVLYETGHFVPRNQLIRESLDWLDNYLGPVK
jgi:predicted Ser/Thr protein kinase/dienelactone hydrolase